MSLTLTQQHITRALPEWSHRGGGFYVCPGSVFVSIRPIVDTHCDNKVYLESIKTLQASQKQGHATKVMRQLCDAADRHGWVIYLVVDPFGIEVMTKRQLMRWYRSLGFRWYAKGKMKRSNK